MSAADPRFGERTRAGLSVGEGPFELPSPDGGGPIRAVLVADGVIVHELKLAGAPRGSAEVLVDGDLVALDHEASLLPSRGSWTALTPSRIVPIDDGALRRLRHDPERLAGLFLQSTRQHHRQAELRAISQLARVEDRLLGLFAHLAERMGRVTPDGIVVDLPVTHDLLGRLIGARRPTVSLAVTKLRDDGALDRDPTGRWLLTAGDLAAIGGDPVARAGQLAGRAGALDDDARRLVAQARETLRANRTLRGDASVGGDQASTV